MPDPFSWTSHCEHLKSEEAEITPVYNFLTDPNEPFRNSIAYNNISDSDTNLSTRTAITSLLPISEHYDAAHTLRGYSEVPPRLSFGFCSNSGDRSTENPGSDHTPESVSLSLLSSLRSSPPKSVIEHIAPDCCSEASSCVATDASIPSFVLNQHAISDPSFIESHHADSPILPVESLLSNSVGRSHGLLESPTVNPGLDDFAHAAGIASASQSSLSIPTSFISASASRSTFGSTERSRPAAYTRESEPISLALATACASINTPEVVHRYPYHGPEQSSGVNLLHNRTQRVHSMYAAHAHSVSDRARGDTETRQYIQERSSVKNAVLGKMRKLGGRIISLFKSGTNANTGEWTTNILESEQVVAPRSNHVSVDAAMIDPKLIVDIQHMSAHMPPLSRIYPNRNDFCPKKRQITPHMAKDVPFRSAISHHQPFLQDALPRHLSCIWKATILIQT